jgi:hypothetical protein
MLSVEITKHDQVGVVIAGAGDGDFLAIGRESEGCDG